jgi:hypothetical protein
MEKIIENEEILSEEFKVKEINESTKKMGSLVESKGFDGNNGDSRGLDHSLSQKDDATFEPSSTSSEKEGDDLIVDIFKNILGDNCQEYFLKIKIAIRNQRKTLDDLSYEINKNEGLID